MARACAIPARRAVLTGGLNGSPRAFFRAFVTVPDVCGDARSTRVFATYHIFSNTP